MGIKIFYTKLNFLKLSAYVSIYFEKIEFVKKKILIYLNMRYRKLVIVPNVLLYINPGCSFPEDAAISICLNGKARSGNTFRH